MRPDGSPVRWLRPTVAVLTVVGVVSVVLGGDAVRALVVSVVIIALALAAAAALNSDPKEIAGRVLGRVSGVAAGRRMRTFSKSALVVLLAVTVLTGRVGAMISVLLSVAVIVLAIGIVAAVVIGTVVMVGAIWQRRNPDSVGF